MNCAVCQNPRPGTVCPVCGFDNGSLQAREPATIAQKRDAFRAGSLRPRLEITRRDKARPWLGLLLGFFLFATWWKACHNPGWPFW